MDDLRASLKDPAIREALLVKAIDEIVSGKDITEHRKCLGDELVDKIIAISAGIADPDDL
jgi:hypothetical protein